jgi:hypothetical protein
MLIMGHGAPRAMNLFKRDYITGKGKWAMIYSSRINTARTGAPSQSFNFSGRQIR